MRYRIPVVALAAVAVFGYGCVQGKVLTDPANSRSSNSDTSKTISLLTITPTSINGAMGESRQLTATAENQGGQAITGVTFTWASSNTQVASVDSTGNVTLLGVGSANISASAGGLTTSVPATATATTVRIASVSVTPSSATLNPGLTQQVQAVALDSIGNVITGTTFTWSSSNTSDATVSATGLVSAIAVGTAVISASAGGKSASAIVSIVAASPASVASVTVSPSSATITTGKTTQLSATLKDSVGNILGGRTVTWTSSNTGVATVSSNGLVTGLAGGNVTISAASGGQQGTAQVTVNAITVASVVVTPGQADLSANQTLQLRATPLDGSGNPIGGQTITWSTSDQYVATVSSSGLVTVVRTTGIGYTNVSATIGGKTGTATIDLIAAPVATVALSPTSVHLNAGQTSQLTATAKDQYGDVITTDAESWNSSRTSVATVSSTGVVTAVGSGSATITVTIGGVQATASVTVAQAAVASVTVSPTSLSLTAGKSSGLTATAKDGSGNVLTGYPESWQSSNSSAATVSTSGVVTGVAAGNATITVSIGGKSATASASISSSTPTVATVTVTPGSSTIQVGNQVQLTATDKTSNGTVVSGQSVSWSSSNTAVATVTSSGIVTAVTAGGATITATSDNVRGTSSITVNASGGGGPYHEPAGMNTQINTGSMTTAPATSYPANTWTEGGTTFTNFSPTTMSSTGEWSQNLAAVPDGPGLRFNYGPTLAGGNSPVRMGASIPNHGTGYLYIRWKFRLSPNWTLSTASGLKVMEPRTVNSSENHVLGAGADGQATDGSNMWFGALLQFSTGSGTQGINVPGNSLGQSPVPSQVFSGNTANVGGAARGAWHVMEAYYQPESPAGAGNGQLTLWVDGTQVFQTGPGVPGSPSGGTHFFLSGESMGWNYLMFDPTYGGDSSNDHPPAIYWDIDELYVSTK
jgi:uncharacterized protein YjdB